MTTDRRVEWSYVEHVPPAQYHPREHADLEASSLQFDNFSNSINSAIFTKIHAKIMFWIVLKHVFQHFQAIFFLIFTKVDSSWTRRRIILKWWTRSAWCMPATGTENFKKNKKKKLFQWFFRQVFTEISFCKRKFAIEIKIRINCQFWKQCRLAIWPLQQRPEFRQPRRPGAPPPRNAAYARFYRY